MILAFALVLILSGTARSQTAKEDKLPKVYLRSTTPSTFEWVAKPEYATADVKEAMEATLERFEGAALERAPKKHPQHEQGWVIRKKV